MAWSEESRKKAAERMKARNADPEFAERNRERMKARNADPEFAERNRERNRERMKARHADPEFNPLAALTASERADYDVLRKKGGLARSEALAAIGRPDLITQQEAANGSPNTNRRCRQRGGRN